jgi:ribosome biogenesis GTPase
MRYLIELGTSGFPAVGDFVVATPVDRGEYRLRALLPRRNALARRKPGKRPDEQVAAANIDILAVVTTGGEDFSDRRIERYVETVSGEDRPEALAIVNKCDLLDEPASFVDYAQALLPTLRVVGVSAKTGAGMEELSARFTEGRTVALAGSSGVGKTSIIRALAGAEADPDDLRIGAVRSDEKGRHTTTVRTVYALPGAALVIDLPGMREVQVLGDDSGSGAFEDIEELAAECKFRDCRHMSEPQCAVKAAVRDGRISQERYQSYLELREEGSLNRAERQRQRQEWGKAIAKATRQYKKHGGAP